jgi:hypothetical protein
VNQFDAVKRPGSRFASDKLRLIAVADNRRSKQVAVAQISNFGSTHVASEEPQASCADCWPIARYACFRMRRIGVATPGTQAAKGSRASRHPAAIWITSWSAGLIEIEHHGASSPVSQ